MTSGHKRKEVASVSVLSEACHLMAGIFKRGVTINTPTPPLNSLVSHLVKKKSFCKVIMRQSFYYMLEHQWLFKSTKRRKNNNYFSIKQENCQLCFRQPRQHPHVHCTMCILGSMFTFQPNKLRHILKDASR